MVEKSVSPQPQPASALMAPVAEVIADAEWLEADGLGGFASGPVRGPRTRRYHALLLTATTPPTGRVVLINGFEAYVEHEAVVTPLSVHRYLPDVLHPCGSEHLLSFASSPWPTWTFRIANNLIIRQEIFVARDSCETVLRWSVPDCPPGYRLSLRPLISGRDYHSLHRENDKFAFESHIRGGNVTWKPYPDLPAATALTNGEFCQAPAWYRNFLYTEERERGLDHVEDLASPGVFTWNLDQGEAVMVLRTGDGLNVRAGAHAANLARDEWARRSRAETPWDAAADSYLVDRGDGRTLLAGFPWFTDWGRDTFIAMRGLMVARGRFADAEGILNAWAATVSEGMLPNRFADSGTSPEFNSADASLWFIVAAKDFLDAARGAGYRAGPTTEDRLFSAIEAILQGYSSGTRYGIRADVDGLLRAGEPGVQLTWMDAKVGDWVVTPRIGKPVEIQALWINALEIGGERVDMWIDLAKKARASFAERFPNPANGGLYDVVDVDHIPGAVDPRIRPNQIFAVGGLPYALLEGAPARRVVDLVEKRLLTPMGLRSLSAEDPDYQPSYRGDPRSRDGAYHQGAVWPWLVGPFVEAWLRTRPLSKTTNDEARARFLAPLITHLGTAGVGHVSEIADGDPPHTPRGCPFQAWSLGELIRANGSLELLQNRLAK